MTKYAASTSKNVPDTEKTDDMWSENWSYNKLDRPCNTQSSETYGESTS